MRRIHVLAILAMATLLGPMMPVGPADAAHSDARTPSSLWDFRIEDVRVLTKEGAGYAKSGPFPESGTSVSLHFRVKAYESSQEGATAFTYHGKFRTKVTILGSSQPPKCNSLAPNEDVTIDKTNGYAVLAEPLPIGNADYTHLKIEINVPCGSETYAGPTGELAKANNERIVTVTTLGAPDFAIYDTVCYTAGCTGADKAGGHGATNRPDPARTAVSTTNATRMCFDDRDLTNPNSPDPTTGLPPAPPPGWRTHQHPCTDASSWLSIDRVDSPGQNEVYFRVDIGNVGAWRTNQTAEGGTGPHANDFYVTYPDGRPITFPVNFSLYRVVNKGLPGEEAIFLRHVRLGVYNGDGPDSARCPAKGDCTVKWITGPSGTPVWTEAVDLYRLGGDLELRTRINPEFCGRRDSYDNQYPDADCANNQGILGFHIKAADLRVHVNETELQPEYGVNDVITFSGWVENVGDNPTPAGKPVKLNFVVGSAETPAPEDSDKSYTLTWPSDTGPKDVVLGAAGSGTERRYFRVQFPMNAASGEACPDEGCLAFVRPGTRYARMVVDVQDRILELDETNNMDQVKFIVEDNVKPEVKGEDLRVFTRSGLVAGSPPEVARGEKFNLTAVVADSDHSIRDVTAVLRKPDGTTLPAAQCPNNCTLVQVVRTGDRQFFQLDFPTGLADLGEWKWRIRAVDPSGNEQLSAEKAFKIIGWKKEVKFVERAVPEGGYPPGTEFRAEPDDPNFGMPANNSVLAFSAAPTWTGHTIPVVWRVGTQNDNDTRNQTGVFGPAWSHQPYRFAFVGPNLSYEFWPDGDGKTQCRYNGQPCTPNPYPINMSQADFTDTTDITDTDDDQKVGCWRKVGNLCDRRRHDDVFGFIFGEIKNIGRYNVTLNVTDVGGGWRTLNHTFQILDEPPKVNISAAQPLGLRVGQSLKIRVTGDDDQGWGTGSSAWLHLSHNRLNATVNLSMERAKNSAGQAVECADVEGRKVCMFERTVTAGRARDGRDLMFPGNWSLKVVVKDKYGTFANTTVNDAGKRLNVTVFEAQAPTFVDFGTTQPEEEVGANVSFYAVINDDTDVGVNLTVTRGGTFVERNTPLKLGKDGRYWFNRSFDEPMELEYRFTVDDYNRSLVQSAPKGISIKDNLPPRVDIQLPNVPGAGYFARAAPALEFKVYDTAQGVEPGTVKVTVNGAPVTAARTPLPDGKGYTVRYTHTGAAYVHGQVVNFSVEAADKSVPPKLQNITRNFTVDAVAPTSKVTSFEPRYQARDGDLWNVSLDTRFTIVAEDADGLPTGIKERRYRFMHNGVASAAFVANGTSFPMSDRPESLDFGDGLYSIQVYAVDDVGNVEEVGAFTPNTLVVHVDQTPPSIVKSKVRALARSVNATFEDFGSGVKSARVHFRFDAEPYQSLDMAPARDGSWFAQFPSRPEAKTISYWLSASDGVGNRAEFQNPDGSPPYVLPIGNRPPDIRIVAPEPGARVSGSTTLRWEATDPDGDPLTVKVYYKPATGRDELELITLGPGTSSYVVNTPQLGVDGLYDFRVTVSDGNFFDEDEIRLDVVNSREVVAGGGPSIAVASPGQEFCYHARVNKQGVAVVEARIYDGERLVKTVPLFDNGVGCDESAGDGKWGGPVTLDEAGDYDVEIFVQYVENGDPKEVRSRPANGGIRVQFTAVDFMNANRGLVYVFAALAVAVFAVGGWAAFRRFG